MLQSGGLAGHTPPCTTCPQIFKPCNMPAFRACYIKFFSRLTFEIVNSISRAEFLFLLDLKVILFSTKAFNLESLQTEGLFIVMIRVQCSLISYLNKNFNGHFLYGLKRPTKDASGIKENQVSF